mmetsp:Transcript_59168/g.122362  ORF Transcript_59168/g.122362 Transcript_59168/m.122362 type:complete len:202 (+) Transcript_59168:72-677(+)
MSFEDSKAAASEARELPKRSAWEDWQRHASQRWQKAQLARSVLGALWTPAVLWGNTNFSRWLPAMAMSHSMLVLAVAWHAWRRLERMQLPGARPVSLLSDGRRRRTPPNAWFRFLWACLLFANVMWTHVGCLMYHYHRTISPRSLRCFRGWLLTVGFSMGSISLALEYVYSEWIFLHRGIRISHFLYTQIAYVVDDERKNH